jgi:hypothetical protein
MKPVVASMTESNRVSQASWEGAVRRRYFKYQSRWKRHPEPTQPAILSFLSSLCCVVLCSPSPAGSITPLLQTELSMNLPTEGE